MGLFRNVIGEVKKATKKASTKLVRRLYKQLEGPEFEELNPKQRLQWDLYERGLLRREQLSPELQAGYPWKYTYTAEEEERKKKEKKTD